MFSCSVPPPPPPVYFLVVPRLVQRPLFGRMLFVGGAQFELLFRLSADEASELEEVCSRIVMPLVACMRTAHPSVFGRVYEHC